MFQKTQYLNILKKLLNIVICYVNKVAHIKLTFNKKTLANMSSILSQSMSVMDVSVQIQSIRVRSSNKNGTAMNLGQTQWIWNIFILTSIITQSIQIRKMKVMLFYSILQNFWWKTLSKMCYCISMQYRNVKTNYLL